MNITIEYYGFILKIREFAQLQFLLFCSPVLKQDDEFYYGTFLYMITDHTQNKHIV